MNTELSSQHERYLEQAVANGTYPDRAAAIDEAIALLMQRDQLRGDVQAGFEQANRGKLLDSESVFARLLERARQIEDRAREKA